MTARRLWAAGCLAIALATAAFSVGVAVVHFPDGVSVLVCLIVAVCAAGYGVQRRGAPRTVALVATVLALAGALVLVVVERLLIEDVLIVVGVGAALAAARLAFRAHVELPRAERPKHPVLFYNPLSGDGKAERVRLAEEARKRGIEPIELRRDDDLEQLVRRSVTQGAGALAMAGGDGSQATVARIASEFGLPYACIPAGTRNHFALDLGVDRDDVVGALDALVEGGERRVDLAEVNGRVFVNNVSLGLYAEAVQRSGYREAKVHTLLEAVPDAWGPGATPPKLRWQSPTGEESAVAILVSNNPYRLGRLLGSGTRPRLDRGLLGIAVLAPTHNGSRGSIRRTLEVEQWTAPAFEIEADANVAAGIDGEAVILDRPLRFGIRSAALRVRIARRHPGVSPSALEPDHLGQAAVALARLALRGDSAQTATQ